MKYLISMMISMLVALTIQTKATSVVIVVFETTITSELNDSQLTTSSFGGKTPGKKSKLPCGEEGTRSDENYFRAAQEAASYNASWSREMAYFNCQKKIAAMLESELSSVAEEYVNSLALENAHEAQSLMEELSYRVINQTVKKAVPICEKQYVGKERTREGKKYVYTTYAAIEMSVNEFLNKLDEAFKNDQKIKLIYDKENFKETFEREQKRLLEKRESEFSN